MSDKNPQNMPFRLRSCEIEDIASLLDIYAYEVNFGVATFETQTPSVDEMSDRFNNVRGANMPFCVAECGGEILGYAYAAPFHPRQAFRYTAEDSVYLAPKARGQGIGKALLAKVIDDCEALGLRQLIAMIGSSENAGSIALHKSLGFAHVGVLTSVGYKFDRWVDVVIMQRALGPSKH